MRHGRRDGYAPLLCPTRHTAATPVLLVPHFQAKGGMLETRLSTPRRVRPIRRAKNELSSTQSSRFAARLREQFLAAVGGYST